MSVGKVGIRSSWKSWNLWKCSTPFELSNCLGLCVVPVVAQNCVYTAAVDYEQFDCGAFRLGFGIVLNFWTEKEQVFMLGKYSSRSLVRLSRVSLILFELQLNTFAIVRADIETHQICCWKYLV